MKFSPAVYIMASRRYGTIYVGATGNIHNRNWEHKEKVFDGFTKKYEVNKLVWYEPCDEVVGARIREAQIKKWKRDWKIRLIEKTNPRWIDLADTL